MKCRNSVAQLTAEEKAQLVQAFLDLKDPAKSPSRIPAAQVAVTNGGGTPNRYDDYVWMHNTVSHGAHRGPAFGPWHREFLHQFEFDLQQVSGHPELTLPYWDWTTDRSAASAGWPFTNDFMGGFGNAGPGPTTGFITTSQFSDPANWRINIRRGNDADLTLKRSRGVPSGAELPTREDVLFALGPGVPAGSAWPSVYDFAPWNDTSGQPTDGQILRSFRKFLERVLHDGIHVWIGDAWEFVGNSPRDGGHMTFPAVAVNDPVFWLHHCNVDRLWSIWQRKAALSAYVPQVAGTATAGHNGEDDMTNLAAPEWFNAPLHKHPNDVQDHQSLGYWYHTDVPEVTLTTPSVFFGSVPELTSSEMPVMFSVRTGRPVTFEITAVAGVNFSQPDQDPVVVDYDHTADVVTAELDVRFQANGHLGVPQSGTATVVATIVDTDGYDSGTPGAPFVLGTWTVNLRGTASPAEEPAPGGQDESAPGDLTTKEYATMSSHSEHDEARRQAMGHDDHEDHDDHDQDHENMAFTMFRRTESGGLVELQAGDIERDTSEYDDEGHDHGLEPAAPTPPTPHHDHDH
jgi:Common central domain of tyrosinase